jgi:hypothetical protein
MYPLCTHELCTACLNTLKAKAVPLHAMKAFGGEEVYSSYSFLTSALDEVSGQRHAPTTL